MKYPQIFNCEQGTDDWFAAKLGVVSSSNFAKVMNKGSGRKLYMRKVVGERLSGITENSYSNKNMDNGIELEAEARSYYEKVNNCNVEQVGFIKSNEFVGTSPDGLVGLDGGLEIKCVIPSTQIETCIKDKMQTCYIPQVQGALLVTGRKWWDWVSYCPAIKSRPYFSVRVYRDEDYIRGILKPALDKFVKELKEMLKKIETEF